MKIKVKQNTEEQKKVPVPLTICNMKKSIILNILNKYSYLQEREQERPQGLVKLSQRLVSPE